MCFNGKVKLITTMHKTQTLYDVVVNGVWFLKPTVPTFPKKSLSTKSNLHFLYNNASSH